MTYPAKLARQPVPLKSSHSIGKTGVRYDYYRLRHKSVRHGKMQAVAGDELAATLPDIPARELDELVIRKLVAIAAADKSGLLMVKARECANEAAGALEHEITELKARRKSAETGISTARRRLADAYMEDDTNVVRAMSAPMDELALEVEQLDAALRGKQDALKVVSNAAGEVQSVRERINLVQSLYAAKDWDSLREVLGSLIERVDVRMDGTQIYLAALPSLRKAVAVSTKLTEVAPTGVYVYLVDLPRERLIA